MIFIINGFISAFLVFFGFLVGCSSQEDHREYWVYISSNNAKESQIIREIIKDYNTLVGVSVLNVSQSLHDSNSTISVSTDFPEGVLGYGSWSRVEEGISHALLGKKALARLGMTIILNKDVVALALQEKEQRPLSYRDSKEYAFLLTVAMHEFGHGVGRGHSRDRTDVMHSVLSIDRMEGFSLHGGVNKNGAPEESYYDYPAYYESIRRIMQ